MDIDPKDLEMIERYIEGSLTSTELQHFNNRLKDDPAFHKLLELRKATPDLLLRVKELEETERVVRGAIKEPYRKPNAFIKSSYLPWAAVAVILMCVAIIFLVFRNSGNEPKSAGPDTRQVVDSLSISPANRQEPKAELDSVLKKDTL